MCISLRQLSQAFARRLFAQVGLVHNIPRYLEWDLLRQQRLHERGNRGEYIIDLEVHLLPRVQSRAAESKRRVCRSFERHCKFCELRCNSCFSFACICLLPVVHVFQCRSRPRNNRSCQCQAACRSCVGNCCQGIQFCLQKPSNYLAEAVHRFCRCLTVATVLDSSCLVISVHVMFISLFLDLMSTVFICK